MLKVLNLEAGIGGNRQHWKDCEVTAVEIDPTIADVYRKVYPQDELIVGCANAFLEQNFSKFDFIWSSPSCPTHGQYRHNVGVLGKNFDPVIPKMTDLYGKIVFLSTYFKGLWVVENVKPYYDCLIQPTFELQRHYFWANFNVPFKKFAKSKIRTKNKISDFEDSEVVLQSNIKNKRQVLRNKVNPRIGLYILNSAKKGLI